MKLNFMNICRKGAKDAKDLLLRKAPNKLLLVIPAQAGIPFHPGKWGSRFRGSDDASLLKPRLFSSRSLRLCGRNY
jgi:hypothetical protein